MKQARDRQRKDARKLINSFKECGCQTLGCKEIHLSVMDFHHLDPGQKDNRVSIGVTNRWSLAKIMDEIVKCVVVCSNCHRKIHAGILKT